MKKLSKIIITTLFCLQATFSPMIHAMEQKSWFTKLWENVRNKFTPAQYEEIDEYPDFFPKPQKKENVLRKQIREKTQELRESMPNWNWGNITKTLTAIAAATGLSIVIYNNRGQLMETFGNSDVAKSLGNAAGQIIEQHPYAATAAGGIAATGALAGAAKMGLDFQAKILIANNGGIKHGEGCIPHNNTTLTKLEKLPNTLACERAKTMLNDANAAEEARREKELDKKVQAAKQG